MAGEPEVPVWAEEGPTPRFSALARHVRTSRRLSQSALALAAGLSPSTVRGWEAARSEPSLPELGRWSRALDLSESLVAAVRATLFAPRAWADRPGIGLGPYLRERRLASGCTLSRAAAELGLPLATLGHYESGRVDVPVGTLSAIVDRFAVGLVERAALCDGMPAFLEWCDSLVARPDRALAAVSRAAYAVTPAEILDRGPAFVRLRTGLLRARLRGSGWEECERLAVGSHALWLAVGERRTEASVALAGAHTPQGGPGAHAAILLVAWRHLGRVRAEELEVAADTATDPAVAAWLRAEAALDLCERRRGAESRILVGRAKEGADATGRWQESWTRRRDAARVMLRLRDWPAAEAELAAMASLEPDIMKEDGWYVRQRLILEARLAANEATARPAGP